MHPLIVLVYSDMKKDYERLFTSLKPMEPPIGLFERIILAIKREKELQNTRRILFSFLCLLIVSVALAPFSWNLLEKQAVNSGIIQFLSLALSDVNVFISSWQSFSLAILESLPVMGIMLFTINMALALFTLRLFLYKKRLLLSYLMKKAY